MSNAQLQQSIHEEALEQYNSIQLALREERRNCLKDRRFYQVPGAQWEGDWEKQFENKPMLEFNSIRTAISDICDDYRSGRMDVVFVSKDGAIDQSLADACAALWRADVQDSRAGEAFYNAFKEMVGGGYGAFRLRTKYESDEYDPDADDNDEDEPQRIAFEIIVDADSSVWWPLDAKRQDKSDARYCFVVSSMTREEYERKYDDDPASWPKSVHQREHDWYTPDVVYVAEYFLKEWEPGVRRYYRGIDDSEISHTDWELEKNEDLARSLFATGFREYRQKKIRRQRVHKYIFSGGGILKDHGWIVGSEIPIVPVYGYRSFIDNVERVSGHVRDVADSQVLKNILMSKLVEINAYSPVEKPILTQEQVAGYEQDWQDDNVVPLPYQLINRTIDPVSGQVVATGQISYTKSPSIPQATGALLQLVDQNMQINLRAGTDTEKIKSHVSGKAIEATQGTIDRKSSEYIDGMVVAMCWAGHVWLSMSPEVYHQPERKMKGIGQAKEVTQIQLKAPVIGPDGRVTYQNDLSRAKFDVAVETGPSSESQSDATVRTMTNILPVVQDPATQSIVTLIIMMNTKGEGSADINRYARQELIKRGVVKPTDEEAQALAQAAQNAQPTPNDQYLTAAAEAEKAKAAKDAADTQLIAARTIETKASTLEKLASIESDRRDQAINEAKTLADIGVNRSRATTDAAASLHGMLTTPAPAPSEEPAGLGSDPQ